MLTEKMTIFIFSWKILVGNKHRDCFEAQMTAQNNICLTPQPSAPIDWTYIATQP